MEVERARLDGKWHVLLAAGTTALWRSEPIIQEFTPDNYTVDPTHEPKRIDFHQPNGTFRGIYRWEGPRRIRVMTVTGGYERPTSFDGELLRKKKSIGPGPHGSSDNLFERVREQ